MFSSFDGEFRRKPIVSIGGASKQLNKQEIIEKAQHERHQREVGRLKNASALKIQSLFRSYRVRIRAKDRVRAEFDAKRAKNVGHLQDKEVLVTQLLFFFDAKADVHRLNWFCQMCVKERQQILNGIMSEKSSWSYKMARLLHLSLKFAANAGPEENIATTLRLVEIFSTSSNYSSTGETSVVQIFNYLVRKNYFSLVRKLCDSRIPPLIEETAKPPTMMAETILDMIMRPLQLVYQDPTFSFVLLRSLTESFFASQFSEQVDFFILPSLASQSGFPYMEWNKCLSQCEVQKSPWLLYSFLKLGKIHIGKSTNFDVLWHLTVLSDLTSVILDYQKPNVQKSNVNDSDDDSDSESDTTDNTTDVNMRDVGVSSTTTSSCTSVVHRSLTMLNQTDVVYSLLLATERAPDEPLALTALCRLCHNLLLSDALALHHFRLLYTLAFRPALLHRLWNLILDTKRPSLLGNAVPLLTVISRGIRLSAAERDAIVPLLAVFASLFCYLLVTIHDTEFYGDDMATNAASGNSKVWMPFTLAELRPMSLSLSDVTLGLIELAFPASRPTVREDYQLAVRSVRSSSSNELSDTANSQSDTQIWSHLFKTTVLLVRQLYTRDTRRQFCPENHWINDRITLPLDRPTDISFRRSRLRQYRPFFGLRVFTREELVEEGPPLSTKEVRLATVLREMPYVISFSQRVLVFHSVVGRDKDDHQGDRVNFLQGKAIHVHIRRNFIYEDAFDHLSQDNEPNLKLKMRVMLVNAAGLDEAGIDGGGLFREFLNELLKTAFDPNRGFFRLTRDQYLYPNPNVEQIVDDYVPHYYFIGRMLGKALYENMLVELPLASFFLSKLLGQKTVNVDIDHLQSLDPELYKNLLYLKYYDGDVQDLGLDFTIVSEEVGQAQVEEMKPGGATIAVTNENRIEYIHLVADFKLNRQIRSQCNAFRQGLADVLNLDWLRMFSYRELQTLISGADHEINVDDLQKHTKYGNGFTDSHATIVNFWSVVHEFTEEQKRKLLKFVTSCSRPPLLGFKELDPPFCIQNVGAELDRLPTASTCMNLLKLPDFQDREMLKNKLLYAVESEAGFELS